MNKTRQFWALVYFQVAINPFVIFFPLAMGAPYIMDLTDHDYHPGLNSLLFDFQQDLFLVGLVGVLLLAPEVMRSGAPAAAWPTGTEFTLTRAVDRHLVFRARPVFFYILILAIPLFALMAALRNPVLQMDEFDKILRQQILDHIPGSVPAPLNSERQDIITIPDGNVLLESWRSLKFLCFAIGTQVFALLIYPLKFRRFVLWGAYLTLVFVPLFILRSDAHKNGDLSPTVLMFFAYVAHQWLFWSVLILALAFGQVWCERRFSTLEQQEG